MNVMFLTDNEQLLTRVKETVMGKLRKELAAHRFSYAYSPANQAFRRKYAEADWIKPVSVNKDVDYLIDNFDVVISLHCKQFFPQALVNGVRCINVHPGLNPYNRGWFPQVFSIINGLPLGATIHEIDEELDHGAIIAQEEVTVHPWDTSNSAYERVLDAEMRLLEANLPAILEGTYQKQASHEGNLNLKRDFDALCKLDLNSVDTLQNHLNKLRALTHGAYKNAYFLDEEGNKVYVKVVLEKEER